MDPVKLPLNATVRVMRIGIALVMCLAATATKASIWMVYRPDPDGTATQVAYAKAANEYVASTYPTRYQSSNPIVQGCQIWVTWGQINSASGTFNWSPITDALDDLYNVGGSPSTNVPHLYGIVRIWDKEYHYGKTHTSGGHTSNLWADPATYSPCMRLDLEPSIDGGDGMIPQMKSTDSGYFKKDGTWVTASYTTYRNTYFSYDADLGYYRKDTYRFAFLVQDKQIKYVAKRWDSTVKTAMKDMYYYASTGFGSHAALKHVLSDESALPKNNYTKLQSILDYPATDSTAYPANPDGYEAYIAEIGQKIRKSFPAAVGVAYNLNWIYQNNSINHQDVAIGTLGDGRNNLSKLMIPYGGSTADKRAGLFVEDLINPGINYDGTPGNHLLDYANYVYPQLIKYQSDTTGSPDFINATYGETLAADNHWDTFNATNTAGYINMLKVVHDPGQNGYGPAHLTLHHGAGTWSSSLQGGGSPTNAQHFHNLVLKALTTNTNGNPWTLGGSHWRFLPY